jgi:hypothetical protein
MGQENPAAKFFTSLYFVLYCRLGVCQVGIFLAPAWFLLNFNLLSQTGL